MNSNKYSGPISFEEWKVIDLKKKKVNNETRKNF